MNEVLLTAQAQATAEVKRISAGMASQDGITEEAARESARLAAQKLKDAFDGTIARMERLFRDLAKGMDLTAITEAVTSIEFKMQATKSLLDQKVAGMEAEMKRRNEEIEKCVREMKSAVAEAREKLEKELQAACLRIKRSEEDLDDLRLKQKALEAIMELNIGELKADMVAFKASVNSNVSKQDGRIAELEKAKDMAEVAVRAMREGMDAAIQRMEKMHRELADTTAGNLKTIRDAISAIETRLKDTRESLENKMKGVEEEVQKGKEGLHKCQKEISILDSKYNHLEGRVRDLEKAAHRVPRNVDDNLQHVLKQHDAEIKDLKEELRKMWDIRKRVSRLEEALQNRQPLPNVICQHKPQPRPKITTTTTTTSTTTTTTTTTTSEDAQPQTTCKATTGAHPCCARPQPCPVHCPPPSPPISNRQCTAHCSTHSPCNEHHPRASHYANHQESHVDPSPQCTTDNLPNCASLHNPAPPEPTYENSDRWRARALSQRSLSSFAECSDDADMVVRRFAVQGTPEHSLVEEQSRRETFKELRKRAERGDPLAQHSLGVWYAAGWGPDMERQAYNWFCTSAKQGHSPAQFALGLRYLYALGVEENERAGFEWIFEAGRRSDCSLVSYTIGFCYTKGLGIEKDAEEAYRWYCRSANGGCAHAQFSLGVCYSLGLGVQRDERRARACYSESAKHGNCFAQNNLGVCLARGCGGSRDEREAFGWFCRSAEKDCVEARMNVGFCLQNGIGVKHCEDDPLAQLSIGAYFDCGRSEGDQEEAFKWYNRSAQQGNLSALMRLGYCYDYGRGVARDGEKAFGCYWRSACQGYAAAQYSVGQCYSSGLGVVRDMGKAYTWFRESAERGFEEAYYRLANCYMYGKGVARDRLQAYVWYTKDAKRGIVTSQKLLEGDQAYAKLWFESGRGKKSKGPKDTCAVRVTATNCRGQRESICSGCPTTATIAHMEVHEPLLLPRKCDRARPLRCGDHQRGTHYSGHYHDQSWSADQQRVPGCVPMIPQCNHREARGGEERICQRGIQVCVDIPKGKQWELSVVPPDRPSSRQKTLNLNRVRPKVNSFRTSPSPKPSSAYRTSPCRSEAVKKPGGGLRYSHLVDDSHVKFIVEFKSK